MIILIAASRRTCARTLITCLALLSFVCTGVTGQYSNAYAAPVAGFLPQAGARIMTSPHFAPLVIRGVKFYPHDPLKLTFAFDEGDSRFTQPQMQEASAKLIRYFLAAVTIPDSDIWVNLSPYEQERIIPANLDVTDMGKGLLAQDYILKQLAASMTYPESPLGKKFWDTVYARAQVLFGTAKIPLNTFNKVWIVPGEALVYEEGDRAVVGKARLKVMMEADYVAMQNNAVNGLSGQSGDRANPTTQQPNNTITQQPNNPKTTVDITSQIMREIIVPVIEEEVNNGKNFAELRQIYHALILANWFKDKIKEQSRGNAAKALGAPPQKKNWFDIFNIYVDQKKVRGVDTIAPAAKDAIYKQYVSAYKQGTYDYIRKETDVHTKRQVRRHYYSGGFSIESLPQVVRKQYAIPEAVPVTMTTDIALHNAGTKTVPAVRDTVPAYIAAQDYDELGGGSSIGKGVGGGTGRGRGGAGLGGGGRRIIPKRKPYTQIHTFPVLGKNIPARAASPIDEGIQAAKEKIAFLLEFDEFVFRDNKVCMTNTLGMKGWFDTAISVSEMKDILSIGLNTESEELLNLVLRAIDNIGAYSGLRDSILKEQGKNMDYYARVVFNDRALKSLEKLGSMQQLEPMNKEAGFSFDAAITEGVSNAMMRGMRARGYIKRNSKNNYYIAPKGRRAIDQQELVRVEREAEGIERYFTSLLGDSQRMNFNAFARDNFSSVMRFSEAIASISSRNSLVKDGSEVEALAKAVEKYHRAVKNAHAISYLSSNALERQKSNIDSIYHQATESVNAVRDNLRLLLKSIEECKKNDFNAMPRNEIINKDSLTARHMPKRFKPFLSQGKLSVSELQTAIAEAVAVTCIPGKKTPMWQTLFLTGSARLLMQANNIAVKAIDHMAMVGVLTKEGKEYLAGSSMPDAHEQLADNLVAAIHSGRERTHQKKLNIDSKKITIQQAFSIEGWQKSLIDELTAKMSEMDNIYELGQYRHYILTYLEAECLAGDLEEYQYMRNSFLRAGDDIKPIAEYIKQEKKVEFLQNILRENDTFKRLANIAKMRTNLDLYVQTGKIHAVDEKTIRDLRDTSSLTYDYVFQGKWYKIQVSYNDAIKTIHIENRINDKVNASLSISQLFPVESDSVADRAERVAVTFLQEGMSQPIAYHVEGSFADVSLNIIKESGAVEVVLPAQGVEELNELLKDVAGFYEMSLTSEKGGVLQSRKKIDETKQVFAATQHLPAGLEEAEAVIHEIVNRLPRYDNFTNISDVVVDLTALEKNIFVGGLQFDFAFALYSAWGNDSVSADAKSTFKWLADWVFFEREGLKGLGMPQARANADRKKILKYIANMRRGDDGRGALQRAADRLLSSMVWLEDYARRSVITPAEMRQRAQQVYQATYFLEATLAGERKIFAKQYSAIAQIIMPKLRQSLDTVLGYAQRDTIPQDKIADIVHTVAGPDVEEIFRIINTAVNAKASSSAVSNPGGIDFNRDKMNTTVVSSPAPGASALQGIFNASEGASSSITINASTFTGFSFNFISFNRAPNIRAAFK